MVLIKFLKKLNFGHQFITWFNFPYKNPYITTESGSVSKKKKKEELGATVAEC